MNEKMPEKDENEEGATFDMYHFFSRKDVLLIGALILLLLLYALYSMFAGAEHV